MWWLDLDLELMAFPAARRRGPLALVGAPEPWAELAIADQAFINNIKYRIILATVLAIHDKTYARAAILRRAECREHNIPDDAYTDRQHAHALRDWRRAVAKRERVTQVESHKCVTVQHNHIAPFQRPGAKGNEAWYRVLQ